MHLAGVGAVIAVASDCIFGEPRPHLGAGHLAQAIMPAISAANCCQMASMSLANRWRMVN